MSEHLIDDLPPLPEPAQCLKTPLGKFEGVGFTADQMRAYVLADRALRGDGVREALELGLDYARMARHNAESQRGQTILWNSRNNDCKKIEAAIRSLGGKQ